MSARKNLVVLRAGRQSLHPQWFNTTEHGAERTWDLYVSPFQEIPVQADAPWMVGDVISGPKWSGIRELLNNWDGWRDYEQVWLPDDDILTSQETINEMFALSTALKLNLWQPALDDDSYYCHFMTMRNRRCHVRMVGFVEIMVPGFPTHILEQLLPTLNETTTGWGWGLDSLWPKILGYKNIGIMDGITVTHTRPVGKFRDEELDRLVHEESDRVMEDYDCSLIRTTYSMIGPDLKPLPLEGHPLTVALVDGWRYLLDANPSVLSWIVEAQRPAKLEYPTAGLPSKGQTTEHTAGLVVAPA